MQWLSFLITLQLTKFTGKHLFQGLFFNKVAGLQLWHRFPLRIFSNFWKHLFTQNTWRLLLPVRALDPHHIILPNCLLASGALLSDWRSTLLFRSFTKANNFELLNNNLHDLQWLTWLAYNNSAKLPPLHRPWNLPRLVEHSLLRAFVVLLLHTQFWFDHVLIFSVIGTL